VQRGHVVGHEARAVRDHRRLAVPAIELPLMVAMRRAEIEAG
jgi:hypothetical protein